LKIGILDSHIVAFENSGHCLFLEETPKFNEELIRFAQSKIPQNGEKYLILISILVLLIVIRIISPLKYFHVDG
jgi:hypothetical protein